MKQTKKQQDSELLIELCKFGAIMNCTLLLVAVFQNDGTLAFLSIFCYFIMLIIAGTHG